MGGGHIPKIGNSFGRSSHAKDERILIPSVWEVYNRYVGSAFMKASYRLASSMCNHYWVTVMGLN